MNLFPKNILRAAVVTAALAGAAVAGAQSDPNTLTAESAPTAVAAYDGTVMWSSLDKATGTYKLLKSVDGAAPVTVGVPESDGPLDIDLGTNRSGSLMAVYTREGFLYRLRVSTGAEERLTTLSIGGHNRHPTIQRGRIAFLHGSGDRVELRIGDTVSGAGAPRVLTRGLIDGVELGISQIAYVVRDLKGPYGFGARYVHVRNIRTGHVERVYRAVSGGANQAHVTKPSFTDDLKAFVWARTNNGSGAGNRIVKYTLRTGTLSYATGSSRFATTAWAGADLGAAYSSALDPAANAGCEDAGTQYCSVGTTGALTFNAKR